MSLAPFANEPVLELRRAAVRAQLEGVLAELDGALPIRVPVLIANDTRGGEELHSTDPGNPERVVAVAAKATERDVEDAVAAAQEGFRRWSPTRAEERAGA